MTPMPPRPLLGRGWVRHKRLRPKTHHFKYPTYFLMLPMRQLRKEAHASLCRNRWGLISFYDSDHGDGRPDSLAWLESVLHSEGIQDAKGEIWLQCYPRVLGYTFKPVSFWYCYREPDSGGGLAAMVVEVNNTFGERHCYLLCGDSLGLGQEISATKVFHVSPFCKVEGQYRFRFMHRASVETGEPERAIVRVDLDDASGPLIETSLSGQLSPISPAGLRSAFFGVPWMTLGVMARIHWQAIHLLWKKVPFFRKPAAPASFVSR